MSILMLINTAILYTKFMTNIYKSTFWNPIKKFGYALLLTELKFLMIQYRHLLIWQFSKFRSHLQIFSSQNPSNSNVMKVFLSLFIVLFLAFLGVVYIFDQNQNSNPDFSKYAFKHYSVAPEYPRPSVKSEIKKCREILGTEELPRPLESPGNSGDSESSEECCPSRESCNCRNANGRSRSRDSPKTSGRGK